MPITNPATSQLLNLITTAATPVVLISATAILLSGFSAKYTAIAGQVRDLAKEFRHDQVAPERRQTIQKQLRLFHRRITAIWGASLSLSISLLTFLATIFSVIFVSHQQRLNFFGALALILGLICMGVAILFELYEISLGRLTVAGELVDILSEDI